MVCRASFSLSSLFLTLLLGSHHVLAAPAPASTRTPVVNSGACSRPTSVLDVAYYTDMSAKIRADDGTICAAKPARRAPTSSWGGPSDGGFCLARRDEYSCGEDAPCANSACCGKNGYCGLGTSTAEPMASPPTTHAGPTAMPRPSAASTLPSSTRRAPSTYAARNMAFAVSQTTFASRATAASPTVASPSPRARRVAMCSRAFSATTRPGNTSPRARPCR